MGKKIEHIRMDEITCPYCGWEDKNSDEWVDYCDTDKCGNCGKIFRAEREHIVTYSTEKVHE